MADAQAYIRDRLTPRLSWYDRRSVLYKKLYLIFQFAGMTGSVLLVLLIHIEAISRAILGAIAAFVTLCFAAERIGRFGKLWWTYRLTAEALATEEQLFRHRVGPYAGTDSAREDLLVERCEALLTREADVWRRTVRNQGSGPRTSGGIVE